MEVKAIVFDLHGVLIRATEMGEFYRLIELDFLHKITNTPKEIIRKNQPQAFQNWLIGFQNLKGLFSRI
ncbi:MAG: hypothetical protein ACFFC7_15880 [Candidatus Hermodarchaeota archaeon]